MYLCNISKSCKGTIFNDKDKRSDLASLRQKKENIVEKLQHKKIDNFIKRTVRILRKRKKLLFSSTILNNYKARKKY